MHHRRLLVGLVLAWSTARAGSASAARVVAVAPHIRPAVPTEIRDRFHDAVARGLLKGGIGGGAVPGSDVRLRLAGDTKLLECDGAGCVPRVAELMAADRVVTTDIEDIAKTYIIKMKVFDADGRELGVVAEDRCEICTVREAATSVEKTAGKLAGLLASPKPRPAPVEKPPEVARPVAPPVEKPALEKPVTEKPSTARSAPAPEEDEPHGHLESHAAAPPAPSAAPAIAAAPVETHPAEAMPAAPAPERVAERGFPYRPVAYAAFAVAGAALVPMAVFAYYAAMENQPSCNSPDPQHSCPNIYHGNVAPAVALGVVSAVAIGAGAILLYLDKRHRRASTPTVGAAPLPGGLAVAASLDF